MYSLAVLSLTKTTYIVAIFESLQTMDALVEPPRCSRPFSTEAGGLHYSWRGEGPGQKAKVIGIYNPITEKWTLQPTTGSPPTGQCAGACISLGNYLYCFGGYADRRFWLNDLHKLNLDTFEWSEVYPRNHPLELPICKDSGGLAVVNERTLICFGGWGTGPTQPGSKFILDTRTLPERYGWTNEFHLLDTLEGIQYKLTTALLFH